jgi:hypothetical protein
MTGDTADPDAWSKASPKEGGKVFMTMQLAGTSRFTAWPDLTRDCAIGDNMSIIHHHVAARAYG